MPLPVIILRCVFGYTSFQFEIFLFLLLEKFRSSTVLCFYLRGQLLFPLNRVIYIK